jgi:hypothetical protein
MAEDAATALGESQQYETLLPAYPVEISTSLAPFMVIYDQAGQPLASNGYLNGSFPQLPPGVFDYANQNCEDRVTWQPEPGVRMAAVVVRYDGDKPGFVLAARSLREVEKRVGQIEQLTVLVWAITLVTSLVVVAGCERLLVN